RPSGPSWSATCEMRMGAANCSSRRQRVGAGLRHNLVDTREPLSSCARGSSASPQGLLEWQSRLFSGAVWNRRDKMGASGDLQRDTSNVAMNGASAPDVIDGSTTPQPTTPPAPP